MKPYNESDLFIELYSSKLLGRRKEREARMEVERASSPEFEEDRSKMETVKTVRNWSVGGFFNAFFTS